MATCPECGYTEEKPTKDWVTAFAENSQTSFHRSGLVVCPDCDAVLGGIEG